MSSPNLQGLHLPPWITTGLLLLGCVGCAEPQPEFGTVTGVVSYRNRPQKGLMVQFLPDPDKGNKWPINAAGITDAEGKYELKYAWKLGEGTGAPLGWHRVIVEDTALGAVQQGGPMPPKRVPDAYTSPASTPLMFELKAGPQTIDISLGN